MAESKPFTEREQEIMAAAWLCFGEQPKPDFKKLARIVGFTNVGSVSNAWSMIRKKLAYKFANGIEGMGNATTTAAPHESATKTTPRKRGKKADGESEETPAKKSKDRKGKATPTKAKTDDEDDGDSGDAGVGNGSEEDEPIIKAEKQDDGTDEDEEFV